MDVETCPIHPALPSAWISCGLGDPTSALRGTALVLSGGFWCFLQSVCSHDTAFIFIFLGAGNCAAPPLAPEACMVQRYQDSVYSSSLQKDLQLPRLEHRAH